MSCRRVTPSARSMARSRVRCATSTEKVLKTRNEPTSSAMPAKTSSSAEMNARLSVTVCCAADRSWAPVLTLRSAPVMVDRTRAASSSGDRPVPFTDTAV